MKSTLQKLTLQQRTAAIRSKLFVPGSRPELFAKAMASAADALSFDLEDSVTSARKEEARSSVAAFLRDRSDTAKLSIVRVNSERHLLEDDLKAVVTPGVDLVNLPKVEGANDVLHAMSRIETYERINGITSPIGLLANIETPRGLRLAYEIASSHPRVIGLQLGFVDLSLQCGIDQTNLTALNAVRLAIRIAAAEAGIVAFDGSYSNIKDADGFRAQAMDARSLGMTGKSCIHPSQVETANEVFTPSVKLVAESLTIARAAARANEAGTGVFQIDGKMIDAPIIERARRIVEQAKLWGLIAEEG